MYVLNLTARGMYSGMGFEFFDIGREWIVKAFKELTTAHMHGIWRKKNTGRGSHLQNGRVCVSERAAYYHDNGLG